jgi:hypothetical protein
MRIVRVYFHPRREHESLQGMFIVYEMQPLEVPELRV